MVTIVILPARQPAHRAQTPWWLWGYVTKGSSGTGPLNRCADKLRNGYAELGDVRLHYGEAGDGR